eukprot:CAMPEP_0114999112 /NCGR_PEP_ID=MMETSP0216-20121206/15943_1 /TAXON_ID=223996 /ORGANISM="Protocruzia adherens, Strain Boccale" /LENGTH=160 /DNA_ID=CAMNT_0002363907 /DNA_START=2165 /DNA_END=2647 /DNA_ORIENTATION=+
MNLSWKSFISAFSNLDFGHEMAKYAGRNVVETSLIEWVDENCYIGYQLSKSPFPMSKRSFVFMAAWKDIGEGKHVINVKSLSHDKKPETENDIRALLLASAYLIEERDEKIHGKFLGAFDLGGSIPSVFLKMADADSYNRLELFDEAHLALKKKGIIWDQ